MTISKKRVVKIRDSLPELDAISPTTISFNELCSYTLVRLIELAESLRIDDPCSFTQHELLLQTAKKYMENNQQIVAYGVLEIVQDGNYGFLRFQEVNYMYTSSDVVIQGQKIRKHNLKMGDMIRAEIRAPKDNEKFFGVTNVLTVNNENVDKTKNRINFDRLTPIYPTKKIKFEIDTQTPENIALRACDLIAPIGFGQRALIIAQPRTGKTVLMQNMAHAITQNHPDVALLVLLIDERPEEVTDMKRSVKGEVISSTFDEPAIRHIQIAELVIEKAKRMVEQGRHVVLFLDSITRLARAYNTVTPSSGKVLSGGIDASAMEGAKRIFGAARNTEESGSLTIIGTALDKNKSQMDFYILQEFSGTGNCEIFLDRAMSDRRIYPAIDVTQSGTRNEEKFFETESELHKRWMIRRVIIPMGPTEGMVFLIDKLKQTKNNQIFFETMNKS
jgi:transcription termination factor Rho